MAFCNNGHANAQISIPADGGVKLDPTLTHDDMAAPASAVGAISKRLDGIQSLASSHLTIVRKKSAEQMNMQITRRSRIQSARFAKNTVFLCSITLGTVVSTGMIPQVEIHRWRILQILMVCILMMREWNLQVQNTSNL